MFRSLAFCVCLFLPLAARADVTVFAAASLKTALDRVAAAFTEAKGVPVRLSYAGSSLLARQIEQGAPADVLLAASRDWMDYLQTRGLIAGASRVDLLGNALVLISREPLEIDLARGTGLSAALDGGRLAMAQVDAVPAGIYGKAALTSLGLWDSVADRLAQTDNVRAALALVALGEAPLGIVYATDARAEPRIHIAATFPETSHPPIVYPVAAIRASPDADAFLTFLQGPAAWAIFAAEGFTPPPAP